MGRRYLVAILHVSTDTLRISFPMIEMPLKGVCVDLEFHDEDGYTSYESEVLEDPAGVGEGLLLRQSPQMVRNRHRGSWRIPVRMKATIKGQVHPRRDEVNVVNMSAGGMLVRTERLLTMGDLVDIAFALPSEAPDTLVAEVVHVSETEGKPSPEDLMGLRFVSPDPTTIRAITRYLWQRIREMHPEGITFLRRNSDRPTLSMMRRKNDRER